MPKNNAEKILKILKNNFSLPNWASTERNPFQTLVITIISQNTVGKNTVRAFEALSKKFPITPEALAKAKLKEIEASLQVAGLFRNKARVIKKVSQIIIKRFNGSLDWIYSMPFEKARETLLSMPGVGPKTADVVLLFSAKKPTIPVDTHVERVSKRLGLVPEAANYEDIRAALQTLYLPHEYLHVHLLFISLGRSCCKALKPLCIQCPVSGLCSSKRIED
ncbi:MAG: endonuclease III domain-containing protein [Candidatus Bathyarchaeales archaeon]